MTAATYIAALSLAVWAYLFLLHGGFWLGLQRDDRDVAVRPDGKEKWPAVTAVIPARNEADMLPRSLASLVAQDYPGIFDIVVVDDQSADGTADVARRLAGSSARKITVLTGTALPSSWTGKVWAMHQGVAYANAENAPPQYILLTDADIQYAPDALTQLVARADAGKIVLTSLMAKLRCQSFAERALVPAFIFFFQMLYPFAWVNQPGTATAAAAGGCMLVDRAALERGGGIAAIRGALIDDCALAKVMKGQGPIWLGLSEKVLSLRPYPEIGDIRRMVARSAYAQLRYSPVLLIGTVIGMALVYFAPPLIVFLSSFPANAIALGAYALMIVAFQPTLHFYRLSPLWGLALPLIAAAYLAFTIDSAYQHRRGHGGMWKGRVQAPENR